MAKFIAHKIDDVIGIEAHDLVRVSKTEYYIPFYLVFENGDKTGPFALRQIEGQRATIGGQGDETTLRELVYGKKRAIGWLDSLFYKMQPDSQSSRRIC